MPSVVPPGKPIKLIVWDLESALWSNADASNLLAPVRMLVMTFDERGILQSVVGRGGPEHMLARLRCRGLAEFFLQPRWGAQATPEKVYDVAHLLNIRVDRVLLISGDPFDRAEVTRAYPEVRAVDLSALGALADDPLVSENMTAFESRPRRLLYLEEQVRRQRERDFQGSRAQFLASLGMRLQIEPARSTDLHRIHELVNRPNQLGTGYSEEELRHMLASAQHVCWLVSLQDRFGDCGKVGLILMELAAHCWTLKLILFSCRVEFRHVDAIVLNSLLRKARAAGVSLRALFRPSSRNERLWLIYLQAGFAETGRRGDLIVATHPLGVIGPDPCPAELIFTGV